MRFLSSASSTWGMVIAARMTRIAEATTTSMSVKPSRKLCLTGRIDLEGVTKGGHAGSRRPSYQSGSGPVSQIHQPIEYRNIGEINVGKVDLESGGRT